VRRLGAHQGDEVIVVEQPRSALVTNSSRLWAKRGLLDQQLLAVGLALIGADQESDVTRRIVA
jgi:hypothetical protein